MKNLELRARKNTTENAKKAVIEFINSFDFSAVNDIRRIESKPFSLCYDVNRNKTYHNRAYFSLSRAGFQIETYLASEEIFDCNIKKWDDVENVFDDTCTFINFKGLIESMEDFIAKINDAVEEKEAQIADFLEYVDGWKNYKASNSKEIQNEN